MHQSKRALLGLGLAGLLTPWPATAGPSPQPGASPAMNPTNFDFLAGSWRIANRRLKDAATGQWETFEGSATVWRVLDGQASIEELRGANGVLIGMGVRTLYTETGQWADHWTSVRNGIVNPPMMGSFHEGVATFLSDEVDNGVTIKARGVWDRITPASCRWHQATSKDGGQTWDPNWFMDWTRV
jgi:hypothetical protein